MRPLYTEFSFGFGISHEIQNLVHRQSLEAPVFPSLLDERTLGWDVSFRTLGWSLFLQFKRSDALTRKTAKQWAVFNRSFYRFPIYRMLESPQHNLLVKLAQTEPHVHYCAPLFYKDGDFNSYFMQNTLLQNSVFIPVRGLPLLADNGQHYLAYDSMGRAYYCSSPKPVEGVEISLRAVEDLFDQTVSSRHNNPEALDMLVLQRLWDNMFEIVSSSGHYHRQAINSIRRISKFLRP